MARSYRTETVNAIYAAIAASPEIAAIVPTRLLNKDNKTGRIKSLVFRTSADCPRLIVKTGKRYGGTVIKADTYASERPGALASYYERQSEFVLQFIYEEKDDPFRDDLENACIAIVTGMGMQFVAGLVSMDHAGEQDVKGTAIIGSRTYQVSESVFRARFILEPSEVTAS